MAAQLSAKMSIDVTGYQKGIDDASKATEQYKTQLKSLTKDIPNLTKETRAAQKETLNLTLAIARLTEEERNSAEGKAMIKMLEESKQKAAKLTDMLGDTREQIRNMASDTLELDAAKDAISLLGNTFSSLQGTIALVTGDTDKMKRAVTAFTTVQSTLNAVTSIANVLEKQKSLMTVLSTKYTNLKKIATNAATSAQIGNTAATNAGKIGQNSFNVALAVGKALLGDWKSLLVAAGVALGGYAAITALTAEDTKKLEEEQKKAKQEEEALTKAQDRHSDMIRDKYVNTVAELRSKYDDLKESYKQLKTEKEKSDWIKKHQKDFEQLGFAVKGVDDANKVLIDNADEMIEYFDLVGQAAALAALKIEAYQEAARLKLLQKEHTSTLGSQFNTGSQLDAATGRRYGLQEGKDYQWKNPNGVHDQIVLTAEGAAKANAESARQSSVTRKNNEEIVKQEQRIESIKEEQLAVTQKQQEVAKKVGVLQAGSASSSTSSSTSSSGSNSSSSNQPTTEVEVKPNLTKMKEELAELENKRLFAKTQEEVDKLTSDIEQKKKEIEAEEIRLHIKVDPAEEELKNTKKKVEEILSSVNVQPEQKLEGNFGGLSKGAQEEANKVLAEYNRVYEARQQLIALINTEGLGEASVDAATEALESLSEQYEDLTEKVTEYNDAASQQKEQQETQEKMVDGWNNVSNALSTTAGAMKQLGADDAAMTVQFMSNAAQMVAQIAKLIPAKQAEAMGNAVAEGTKAPWPIQIATIASLIGTVIATFASLPKFAGGGVITGPFNSGDRMIARVNNGEMILNNRQQSHLFKAIDENKLGGSSNVNVSLTDSAVHGSTMYLTLKNYMKESGKTL